MPNGDVELEWLTLSGDRLLQRLREHFEIEKVSDRFGKVEIEYYCLKDPDSLLDEKTLLDSHGELKWQPYWAQNWEAANGIAEELSSLDLNERQVLDLGCGLGVTGAIAAAGGARVVLADNAPPALCFAQVNCLPWKEQTSVVRLDWRRDDLKRKFDFIVGSDILYDRKDIEYLDKFWRRHLADDGRVLLGDPNRPMTREYFEMLQSAGWYFERTSVRERVAGRPVRIVELRLK